MFCCLRSLQRTKRNPFRSTKQNKQGTRRVSDEDSTRRIERSGSRLFRPGYPNRSGIIWNQPIAPENKQNVPADKRMRKSTSQHSAHNQLGRVTRVYHRLVTFLDRLESLYSGRHATTNPQISPQISRNDGGTGLSNRCPSRNQNSSSRQATARRF